MDMQEIESALRDHMHIALDLDDCLLDGPHSRLLTDYMAAHPDKQFSIITNRPGRFALETKSVAYGLLLRRGIGHDFRYAHVILSPDDDLCGDTVDVHFKGKSAALIGATVLVDDDRLHLAGAQRYGVEFLHLPCAESPAIKTGLF